jgi:gliding motility-associated lipoprotein GldD
MIRRQLSFPFFCVLCLFVLMACNSPYTPRPKGYYRIDFPEKKYQRFEQAGYPYSFDYPVYAQVVKDSTFFGERTENPWWINVDFPHFNARVYISYKAIGPTSLEKLVGQGFAMAGKHSVKAYAINDSAFENPQGVKGVFFNLEGDVATANQFFLTDSVRHFLRGALYFDATPNADSLAIVNRFLVTDLQRLIQSFTWKNPASKNPAP